jgi:small subunit ribosomal protein S4
MISKPKYKMCRRLGAGIYEKCQTQKYVASEAKKNKKDKRRKAPSIYGSQMLEKQKIRYSYGINERQLQKYVGLAQHQKASPVSDKLYQLLESRLDNVVYRLGWAPTRALARQMCSHGHILVNGKRLKVPSHIVSINDTITPREGSRASVLFTELPTRLKTYSLPNWLKADAGELKGTVSGIPKNVEGYLDLNTVLEFYSR